MLRTPANANQVLFFVLLVLVSTAGAGEIVLPEGEAALHWKPLASIPDEIGLAGPFAGVDGDALIVAGGANFPAGRPWDGHPKVWHDRIFVLEKPEGQWKTAEALLPRPLAYGVSLNTERGILCLGGGDKQRHYADVFLLVNKNGQIKHIELPSMPGPSAFFCGALVGDTVYVAGGLDRPDAKRPQKTFWALDLSKPDEELTWEELEPWPGRPRMLSVAAAQDGMFLLFSGVDLIEGEKQPDGSLGEPRREYLTDAYAYSPKTGWRRLADLPRPAVAAPTPAIPLGRSHVAIIGGDSGQFAFPKEPLNDNHPGFDSDILAYHLITDTWVKMGEFPKQLGPDPVRRPQDGTWSPVTTPTVPWRGGYAIPCGEARPGVRTSRVLWAELIDSPAPFGLLDYLTIAVYLLSLVFIGIYFSRREKTTNDFFLGGQRVPWWAAGLSIFGTQLSAITFMAIPAKAYATDWIYCLGNFLIIFSAPLIIYVYLPFYRRLNVTTAYEYLEKRFNLGVRLLGSAAFVLLQLGRMGVVLLLPAMALSAVTGFDVFLCIVIMGVLATTYTVMGGIEAVIWTDVIQVIVLMGGAVLCLFSITAGIDGGMARVISMGFEEGKFHTFDWTWDMTTTAVWVVVVGKFMETLVPYTADQTVVQRYLTTADEKQAARSIWTNAVLSIPSTIIFFGVGTALWAFYKVNPGLQTPIDETDRILPLFIAHHLPVGIAGLVIAALFSAAMSSLDSSMNSIATALTTDWYGRFRPRMSDHHRLNVARVLTVFLGVLGTGFAIYMALLDSKSMWDQSLKILGLFGGGLAGLFAVGIFTRGANGAGALVGFFASAVILWYLRAAGIVHFFLYAAVGIVGCAVVTWLVSQLCPWARKDIEGLTVYTIESVGEEKNSEV
ncbi:MAG: sodium/solute symporter [Pirellulales bacterium]|nr:sodium/solute symporter [Pirellulales bacterium]